MRSLYIRKILLLFRNRIFGGSVKLFLLYQMQVKLLTEMMKFVLVMLCSFCHVEAENSEIPIGLTRIDRSGPPHGYRSIRCLFDEFYFWVNGLFCRFLLLIEKDLILLEHVSSLGVDGNDERSELFHLAAP